jgi:DNA-binding Lrp family transcriptional regulator
MDLIDRKLLNLIQSRFPLVVQPYREIGKEIGIAEQEVIDRLFDLKRKNVVRQISAIFDTRRLGYKTTLVALAYAPDRLHRGALRINLHPGVSHNYAREGSYYNLWFTIAVPPGQNLESTVKRMARDTEALSLRVMPTIRFFKIGVNFDMVKRKGAAHSYSPDDFGAASADDWNKAVPVTESDKAAIRELQEDLSLVSRPFDDMAMRLGFGTAELFALASDFQNRRIMRRFSAVLHHRRSGFRANAMVVWKVPSDRSEEIGMLMAQHSAVTHCYERPTFPDWPYTHFTMVHAPTQEECEEVTKEIAEVTGVTDRLLLYSTREYKKTRVRYFVDDFEQYQEKERACLVEPAG